MELITGATGYVGSRLVARLARDGRPVRAAARHPSRVEDRPGVEPVRVDVVTGEGLAAALEACTNAYYLVHSMERADYEDGRGFADRDRRGALNFVEAAAAAGVRRAIYLGGILWSISIWTIPEGFGGSFLSGATDIGTAIMYVLVFIVLYSLETLPAATG